MNSLSLKLMVAMAGVITLCGCTTGVDTVRNIDEEIAGALQEGIASQPPQVESIPPAVTSALLPPMTVNVESPDTGAPRHFDITVANAPARQFFMSLVDGTPFNMVVHPNVEGEITLDLKNVTIPDVMAIVRNVYGYEFQRTRYGYEVLPARLQARVYQVNYLNILRSGTSETRVSSGQVSQAETGNAGTDDFGDSGGAGTANVSGTRINTEQPETTFWSELQDAIEAIVGNAPGRSTVVNPQTGIVVVRAMPSELREVETFLGTTEAVAQRQVILEAKILEVELSDSFQQGINWAAVFSRGNKSITLGQTGGGSLLNSSANALGGEGQSIGSGDGVSIIGGNTGNLDPNSPAPILGTAASAFGGMFTAALALSDFTAFIELLETQGDVHVLSSPRIATMNNQKAVIKVGSDEFFVTDVSTTTVTGTATTTSPDVELTPFFSGIALDVTPQISQDGQVILHVHPAVSRVQDQEKTVTIGNITQVLPLAFSTVRESDSIVRAGDGQVVVIGGLMQNIAGGEEAMSPGLGNIPGLGRLFRHRSSLSKKSELVILLRPMVVNGSQPWTRMMHGSAHRLEGFGRTLQQREAERTRTWLHDGANTR